MSPSATGPLRPECPVRPAPAGPTAAYSEDVAEEPKSLIAFDEIPVHHAYTIGSGLVVPRPIGWIGTVSADGVPNLAPYSFFNMVANNPPTFVVAPMLVGRKDTLANLTDTGVCTVNIVTNETFEAMNASAATVEADVDEFEHSGLTAIVSDTCAAPRVAEATANFECRVADMVPVGRPIEDGREAAGMLVILEADRLHVAERVIDGHHIDQHELKAIGRHAGPWYNRTADALTTLDRPD